MARPAPQPGPWRLLLREAPPRWRAMGIITLLTLASAVGALLQPWPLQVLVDHVLGEAPAPEWVTGLRARLPGAGGPTGAAAWAAAATLFIFAGDSAVDMLLTMRWVRVGQGAVYALGRTLFARLQRR